ncbi:ABC transporter ATP-binding protein [Serratia marcescens]|uniref:ABC transporter ATP-binding protein n=1 Tax=Serratia marcescens TaxID=615 RepID=UPI0013764FC2|nr:ABC transporter ATP-binding protein [Serratia marcescens]NCI53564.1 ABC transporter ATP-binding protein [Serratia marcescens]NDJ07789.1 ABC transporter ATP-binding protein [Serratia marcescens]NDJ29696.1 ABC transporter ATP-binding protein [Serratia marcescens]NDJ44997.1 ABC transporter ATP-binding protein [Serratia marcescens]NDJ49464.1 ABC transporter ATP-binding protein [Serratia marcescens]
MKLLGQPGRLVASVPKVARSLNLALLFGSVAGLLNVSGIALLAWAVTPLLSVPMLPPPSFIALTGSVLLLVLAFWLRLQAEARAHEASYQLEEVLRGRLVEHLSCLPLGVVQQWGSGRLRKILQEDVKALHIAVADAVPFIGASLSQPLAALLVLALVQWRLALVALLFLPINLVCMAMMARENPQQRNRYNEASESVNAGVIELVQGMAVMRTFDNGAAGWRRFNARLQQFTSAVETWMAGSKVPWKINRLAGAALPTAAVLMIAGFVLYQAGQVTLAQWLLALMLGTLPIKALEPLVHLANYLNDAGAASGRIEEVLRQDVLPEPLHPQQPQGHALSLNKVSFHYPDQPQPALSDVSLTLAAGTRCAIVGASGSGKSTLARLIPRFYDVTEGSITLGGSDIRQMRSDVLLKQMALVLQEPFLISGTLEENLRLAAPEASDAALQQVMAATGVSEIVSALPQGLNTQIGERGSSLSGGQRQRVALARALLSNAPVLVMDEATSYLDAHNERHIQQALAQLAPDRIVITIAHRLQTVIDADVIVVMHEGRVAEQGRHADLLKQGGYYARLWQHYQLASQWTLKREGEV